MIKGYTAGVFDLFHVGHLNILKKAKSECDHLIVALTSDELCFQRKGTRPFIPFLERKNIVHSIKYVDEVVPQIDMDKFAAWERYQFQKMFVGDDWKGHPTWEDLELRLKKVNCEVVFFPYTEGTSSTQLRNALKALSDGGKHIQRALNG
ncbi:MAG: adenylyltransferase/cytidyltransferase family protein [Rhodobacterales bacterium]